MLLLISRRYSDDSRLLAEAARQRGWDVHRLQGSTVPPELLDTELRLYAEGLLAEHLAGQVSLELLRPADDLLAQLPAAFLGRQVRFTTAQNFERPANPAFIKPADQKFFTAKVYEPDEAIPGLELLQPSDPLLISQVVHFRREYRFFVRGGQVRTGSLYWLEDHLPYAPVGYEGQGDELWPKAHAFAQQICRSGLDFPASFVLDVGLLDSGQWAVIEFNPTWASGIYSCSPEAVLDCLEASQLGAR